MQEGHEQEAESSLAVMRQKQEQLLRVPTHPV